MKPQRPCLTLTRAMSLPWGSVSRAELGFDHLCAGSSVASFPGTQYQGSEIHGAMPLLSNCLPNCTELGQCPECILEAPAVTRVCLWMSLSWRQYWETTVCPCLMQELSKQICLCETNFLLVSCKNLHPCNKADCHLRCFVFFFNSIRLFGELVGSYQLITRMWRILHSLCLPGLQRYWN